MIVSAVQMEPVLGDVAANLAQAESLTREAVSNGAELVVLPEFFTSGISFHPLMNRVHRPFDGEPLQLLSRLARELNVAVGGSFLATRCGDTYNTFVLALPNGQTFLHDKDEPTMWENCYYKGGTDNGLFQTPWGTLGIALCWEFLRTRTLKRLAGAAQLVVGGSCWWDVPEDAPPSRDFLRLAGRKLLREVSGTFARMLGVPVVHASHVGSFLCRRMDEPAVEQKRRYLGETQIVDSRGTILERMTEHDGPGIIVAEVTPCERPRPESIPDTFWIPELPEEFLRAWIELGQAGRRYYRDVQKPSLAGSGTKE
jgi:N-carbamoylputrescine amidase